MHHVFTIGLFLFLVACEVSAAEIYRCRLSQGGEFWSSNVCSRSGGFMVDIVQVPGNMSFQEQAKFADNRHNAKANENMREQNEQARQRQCAALDMELKQIFAKYEGGRHVPVEQVGPDQIRTRELNVSRANLACSSR